MPRSITAVLRAAAYAPQTDQVLIMLVTLTHPSLSVPIRLSTDLVNTVSRGATFVAMPIMDVQLPDDIEDRPARARLTLDNISREMVDFVRGLPSGEPAEVTLEFVLGGTPNAVAATFGPFDLPEPEYDQAQITGDLVTDDRSNEGYPEGSYTPDMFPALHRRV